MTPGSMICFNPPFRPAPLISLGRLPLIAFRGVKWYKRTKAHANSICPQPSSKTQVKPLSFTSYSTNMQFTTIAITFAAAVAAVAPNAAAKQQFIDNYVHAKRQAVASASASARSNGTVSPAPRVTTTAAAGAGALPTSTSDATSVVLSGSALFAGIVALVL